MNATNSFKELRMLAGELAGDLMHLGRGGAAGGSGTPEKSIAVSIRPRRCLWQPENERALEGWNRPELMLKSNPDKGRKVNYA